MLVALYSYVYFHDFIYIFSFLLYFQIFRFDMNYFKGIFLVTGYPYLEINLLPNVANVGAKWLID